MQHNRLKRVRTPTPRLLVADLVRDLGRLEGWSLTDPKFPEQVGALISEAARTLSREEHLVYGKRVEAVFPYVVAQLASADLVVEEGAGEQWAATDVVAPDWRVVVPDVGSILVEVKNQHHRRFDFANRFKWRRKQHDALRAYAALVDAPLFYAVWWTSALRWTLVAAEDLVVEDDDVGVAYREAQDVDQMSLLGDIMLSMKKPVIADFIRLDERGGVKVYSVGGDQIGAAGATFIEEIIIHSRCTVDEEEVVLDGYPATRFTIRTRVGDEKHLLTEPLSAMITFKALRLNDVQEGIPPVLHAPTSEHDLRDIIDRAKAEGLTLDEMVFSKRIPPSVAKRVGQPDRH
jgi:hypothetical protein